MENKHRRLEGPSRRLGEMAESGAEIKRKDNWTGMAEDRREVGLDRGSRAGSKGALCGLDSLLVLEPSTAGRQRKRRTPAFLLDVHDDAENIASSGFSHSFFERFLKHPSSRHIAVDERPSSAFVDIFYFSDSLFLRIVAVILPPPGSDAHAVPVARALCRGGRCEGPRRRGSAVRALA